ncbi:uncharacterized protein LTR77_000311 [Saxophila tyrrhenica]|uniref:Uncharacterized protein n=1 Tax=Saxophila tyrrhenica TaxID=1690608 RepID=A0AAV9PMB6_9PEZI|nr:hypothetical protein LTR77_000311 [Saxophila tyrrhenica]
MAPPTIPKGQTVMCAEWTVGQRMDEQIGINMPFAEKKTFVYKHATDDTLYWSTNRNDIPCNRALLLTVDELDKGYANRSRKFNNRARYSVDRVTLIDGQEHIVMRLTIRYPLFTIHKVKRTERCLVDLDTGKEIEGAAKAKGQPQRKNYWFSCASIPRDRYEDRIRLDDPSADLVTLSNGRIAYRDFVEEVYRTKSGEEFFRSELGLETGMGVFESNGETFIWKANPDDLIHAIPIYEADNDRRARRYFVTGEVMP